MCSDFLILHRAVMIVLHKDSAVSSKNAEINALFRRSQKPTHQNTNKVGRCFMIYIITSFCSSQLYKEIELCSKITKVIQFDRDESCMIGYGRSHLNDPILVS